MTYKMIEFINTNEYELKKIFHAFYSDYDKNSLRKRIKEIFGEKFSLFIGATMNENDKPVIGFQTSDKKYRILYDESFVNGIELKITYAEGSVKLYDKLVWYNS